MDWNKLKDSAKDLAAKGMETAKEKIEEKKDEIAAEKHSLEMDKLAEKERIAKMDKEGTVYCPKCKSTNITGGKRGWKVTTGLLGSSKIINTCMKCGNQWRPGKK